MGNKVPHRVIRCIIGAVLPEEAYNSTVCLGSRRRRRFFPCGTGTVFKSGGEVLCVTAAHVIEEAKRTGGSLYIIDKSRSIYPVIGNVDEDWNDQVYLTPNSMDMVVIRIPQKAGRQLLRFPLLELSLARALKETALGAYCLIGYTAPCFSRGQGPLHLPAWIYDGPTLALHNYDRSLHLLFKWTEPDFSFPSLLGAKSVFVGIPHGMRGMSGGSVWGLDSKIGNKWDSEGRWTIVGFQTGLYPETGVVKATRWANVVPFVQGKARLLSRWEN